MSYVNDLPAAWARYVVMDRTTVIQTTNPQSAAYEPDFAAAIAMIRSQGLFGFADYTGSCAYPNNGNNKFIGNT
jgi:hypothetical protein